jgi:prepilin-type N-terminal cleavage/methylation domain-containing protein
MTLSPPQSRPRAESRAPGPSAGDRRGYSLAELLIAVAMFGIVTTAAVTFLLKQSEGMRALALRSAQVQNARFGRDVLRQELRTVGTNITETQPMVVLANDSTFAFNADLLTNRVDATRFTGAVYVDPYATNAEASALTPAGAITVPGSNPAVTYPLAWYTQVPGTPGEAELVVFRFVVDTSVAGGAEYLLLRQVNAQPPQVVASGLRKSGTTPFFRYWHDPSRFNSALTSLDTVPRGWLPLAKTVALRGVAPDTGTAVTTRIDALRAVEVTYETMAPVAGRRDVVRYMVPLPNTVMPRQARACGRPPIAPTTVAGAWNADSGAVLVSWGAAVDDGTGEQDAVRYVLWRKAPADATWPEPLATVSVVGGVSTYRYRDAGVQAGQPYQYAVAVQDCTPNLSSIATSAPVLVPVTAVLLP